MKVVRTVAEMAAIAGGDLGLVPTMGAFHEGHLSLMREARKHHERVAVSLFVNPLQFGRGEDLAKYPRDEERDFGLAKEVGVDVMFAPTATEIYPRESTTIHVPAITERWEGKIRPGHFDGVATIVAKLFNIILPRVAYFGWKDLQQCLVLRRMTEDLRIPVELQFLETVRESDGLALSSRNVYLSPEERARAPLIRKSLLAINSELGKGAATPAGLIANAKIGLQRSGFDVDYLELVSMDDLVPTTERRNAVLIIAARIGTTRLIDNLQCDAVSG